MGKLDGKMLGCRELVVLHDAQAHPLLATTHRGAQHLRVGLPQRLHCYEQATGQVQVKPVVVDREGMAAELLAQLHQEGRQVVTRLGSDQYEGEGSVEQLGAWHALALQPSWPGDLRSGISPVHLAATERA